MTYISSEIRIDASTEHVWNILADLGGVKRYNPAVRDSAYNPGRERGVGASRHCDLEPFGSVEETAIEWNEGESYTLMIHDGKKVPPFKKALGTLAVEQHGSATRAKMIIEYDLKFGPIGRIMDRFIVRPRFEKVLPAILSGLKTYAEKLESPANSPVAHTEHDRHASSVAERRH